MCSRPNDPAGEAPGGPKTSGTLGTTRSSRVQRKNGERDACGQRSADLPLKAPVAYHMLPCWLRGLAAFGSRKRKPILDRPEGIGPLSASPQLCEHRSACAWDGDYTQAETPTTRRCRPVFAGYCRRSIDHLRLFRDWLWRREDVLSLSDLDRAGFAV